MKTNIQRQRGAILLVVIAAIAMLFIAWAGWKIMRKLKDWHPDPHHGQGTNAEPESLTAYRVEHPEMVSNLTVTVTLPDGQTTLTLPLSSLSYEWYMGVRESSNLVDWVNTDLDWEEALELNRTNHSQPMKFYQRVLVY